MPDNFMSRGQFLKLMTSTLIVGGISVVGVSSLFRDDKRKAKAQAPGSWAPSTNTLDVGIHAALLNDGKVFYLAGSANHNPQADGPFKHAVWDPVTDTHTLYPLLTEDLFCAGLATLANGNILLAGGTLEYDFQTLNGKFHGLKAAYEVDFNTGHVADRTEMKHGRWYPTCVELPDGKVLTVLGFDEYGCRNYLAEIYDSATGTWAENYDPNGTESYCVGHCEVGNPDFPQAGTVCYGPGTVGSLTNYPRMHLMPNGLVYAVGQGVVDRLYDPTTSRWYVAATGIANRFYGTSVLCPLQNTGTENGKVLICGGSPQPELASTNSAQIADPSAPFDFARRTITSLTYARKHPSPVILPTGEIIIFGGNGLKNDVNTAVYAPEMFNPVNETWTVLPAAQVPRLYHSIALLLQDGRVWNAGTTLSKTHKELRTEIFSPWYVSATRPTIAGDPTVGGYGATITIPTPEGADITKVSLVKQSSTTHHYNTDQRLIWLQIVSQDPVSVTVSAPINNRLAPPGMYLIHVLNGLGVPSVGKFIQIPGTSSPPDIISPDVEITSPEEGATITGPSSGVAVNVAGTAVDNTGGSGIQKVDVQIDADPFVLATPAAPGDWSTWSASVTATSEGSHIITARARDNSGNIKDDTTTVSIAFVQSFTSIYQVTGTTGTNNYLKLYTGNLKRAGEIVTGTSILKGQSVKRVSVVLRKSGNPTGTITVVVRKGSGDTIQLTFGTINASTLTTTDQTFTLTAPSSYTFASNDKVLVEWPGTGASAAQVWVKRLYSTDPAVGFNGANTKASYFGNNNLYASHAGSDLAGEWFKEN